MARWEIDNIAEDIDFECSDITKRTIQNAKNLLMTRMGEVPYDRMRGIDPALFELPIGEVNDLLMREIDRVLAWEPDVSAVSAKATLLKNGQVMITCVIETEGD